MPFDPKITSWTVGGVPVQRVVNDDGSVDYTRADMVEDESLRIVVNRVDGGITSTRTIKRNAAGELLLVSAWTAN